MNKEEFNALLEEAFMAGYNQAEIDFINESHDYFDLEREYNFYLEARNDTGDIVAKKNFIRGVNQNLQYGFNQPYSDEERKKIVKGLVRAGSKNKYIKDKTKGIKDITDAIKSKGVRGILGAKQATAAGLDAYDKGAQYARGYIEGKRKAGEKQNIRPENLDKDQKFYSDYVGYMNKTGRKLAKSAYKTMVKPKYDKESYLDKIKKGDLKGIASKVYANELSDSRKNLKKKFNEWKAGAEKNIKEIRKRRDEHPELYKRPDDYDETKVKNQLNKEANAVKERFKNKKETHRFTGDDNADYSIKATSIGNVITKRGTKYLPKRIRDFKSLQDVIPWTQKQ